MGSTTLGVETTGSRALSARIDPEDLREVISDYQKCVAATVRRRFIYLWNGKSVAYLDRDNDGWWVSSYSVPPRATVVTDGVSAAS